MACDKCNSRNTAEIDFREVHFAYCRDCEHRWWSNDGKDRLRVDEVFPVARPLSKAS